MSGQSLNSGNKVTISYSCMKELPAGDYHYNLFSGLDTFSSASFSQSPDNLTDEIYKLEKETQYLKRQLELAEEREYFAKELLVEVKSIVESETRATKIKTMVERSYSDSSVEF